MEKTQSKLKEMQSALYFTTRLFHHLSIPPCYHYDVVLCLIGLTEQEVKAQYPKAKVTDSGLFEDCIPYIRMETESAFLICAFNEKGQCCRAYRFRNTLKFLS